METVHKLEAWDVEYTYNGRSYIFNTVAGSDVDAMEAAERYFRLNWPERSVEVLRATPDASVEPTDYGPEDEPGAPVVRTCEDCRKPGQPCEEIPLAGYSLYLCRACAAARYRNGEAI